MSGLNSTRPKPIEPIEWSCKHKEITVSGASGREYRMCEKCGFISGGPVLPKDVESMQAACDKILKESEPQKSAKPSSRWQDERSYLANRLYGEVFSALAIFEREGQNAHQRTQGLVENLLKEADLWVVED